MASGQASAGSARLKVVEVTVRGFQWTERVVETATVIWRLALAMQKNPAWARLDAVVAEQALLSKG